MEMFTAVFTSPDPEAPLVFWGAFAGDAEARKAIAKFVADRPYWKPEEFTLTAFPFGVML